MEGLSNVVGVILFFGTVVTASRFLDARGVRRLAGIQSSGKDL
jgi:hypothetical protein